MDRRGRCQQAIDDRGWLRERVEAPPLLRDIDGHGEDSVPVPGYQPSQPAFQTVRLPRVAWAYPLDPLPDFANHKRAEVGLGISLDLVPSGHVRIRGRFP